MSLPAQFGQTHVAASTVCPGGCRRQHSLPQCAWSVAQAASPSHPAQKAVRAKPNCASGDTRPGRLCFWRQLWAANAPSLSRSAQFGQAHVAISTVWAGMCRCQHSLLRWMSLPAQFAPARAERPAGGIPAAARTQAVRVPDRLSGGGPPHPTRQGPGHVPGAFVNRRGRTRRVRAQGRTGKCAGPPPRRGRERAWVNRRGRARRVRPPRRTGKKDRPAPRGGRERAWVERAGYGLHAARV